MVAYVTRVPAGVVGAISRFDSVTVSQEVVDSATPPTAFGTVTKLVAGKLQPIAANDPASVIDGWLVRPYPAQSTTNAFGAAAPPVSGVVDRMRRGFMAVLLKAGTAVKDAPVFVRTVVNGAKAVGDVEAASDVSAAGVPGANTGNGTIGTLSATAATLAGAWKVTFLTATTFSVNDPNGDAMKSGATGVAYTSNGLTFTITAGGTAFVANDSFTVTVTTNTVPVPTCVFQGPADANGIVEISYNI